MSPFDKFMSAHRWSKRTSHGRGIFRCEAHDDKSASGTISEKEDGRILIHCHAGCSPADVVGAVGLTLTDLFPPRPIAGDFRPRESRPVHAEDALKAAGHELAVAYIILSDMVRHHREAGFTNSDMALVLGIDEPTLERFLTCVERVQRSVELSTGTAIEVSQEAQRIREEARLRPQEEKDLEDFLS